jgi:aspartyl protease family protein
VFWAVVFGIVLLGLIVVLSSLFPGALSDENRQIGLTHHILWLVLLGSSLILGYRGRAHAAFKHALAWIAIALVLVLGYSYRHDLTMIIGRVGGELMPTVPMVVAGGDVELRATDGGHFQADAEINGARVRLLVDTGATTLALSPDDAERAGYNLDALSFDRPVNTANGRAYVAYVRVESVEIGTIRLQDIAATVHRDGLDVSLLGMNVLDRLSGFERRGDRLILRP